MVSVADLEKASEGSELWCDACDVFYSACASDYFYVTDSKPMVCQHCGKELALVRRRAVVDELDDKADAETTTAVEAHLGCSLAEAVGRVALILPVGSEDQYGATIVGFAVEGDYGTISCYVRRDDSPWLAAVHYSRVVLNGEA